MPDPQQNYQGKPLETPPRIPDLPGNSFTRGLRQAVDLLLGKDLERSKDPLKLSSEEKKIVLYALNKHPSLNKIGATSEKVLEMARTIAELEVEYGGIEDRFALLENVFVANNHSYGVMQIQPLTAAKVLQENWIYLKDVQPFNILTSERLNTLIAECKRSGNGLDVVNNLDLRGYGGVILGAFHMISNLAAVQDHGLSNWRAIKDLPGYQRFESSLRTTRDKSSLAAFERRMMLNVTDTTPIEERKSCVKLAMVNWCVGEFASSASAVQEMINIRAWQSRTNNGRIISSDHKAGSVENDGKIGDGTLTALTKYGIIIPNAKLISVNNPLEFHKLVTQQFFKNEAMEGALSDAMNNLIKKAGYDDRTKKYVGDVLRNLIIPSNSTGHGSSSAIIAYGTAMKFILRDRPNQLRLFNQQYNSFLKNHDLKVFEYAQFDKFKSLVSADKYQEFARVFARSFLPICGASIIQGATPTRYREQKFLGFFRSGLLDPFARAINGYQKILSSGDD